MFPNKLSKTVLILVGIFSAVFGLVIFFLFLVFAHRFGILPQTLANPYVHLLLGYPLGLLLFRWARESDGIAKKYLGLSYALIYCAGWFFIWNYLISQYMTRP